MGLVLAASRRRYSWDRIRTSPALHTNLRAWDKQCAALRGLANDVDQIPIQRALGPVDHEFPAGVGRLRVVGLRGIASGHGRGILDVDHLVRIDRILHRRAIEDSAIGLNARSDRIGVDELVVDAGVNGLANGLAEDGHGIREIPLADAESQTVRAEFVDERRHAQAAGRAPTGRARVVAIRIRGQVGAGGRRSDP